MIELILYTRNDCELCREMEEVIAAELPKFEARLERIEIDGDPELEARFGLEVPVLFVVPRPGRTIESEALLAHCRTHLSAYKVPLTVRLIAEIPRTGSGKIIRYKLREQPTA